MRLGRAIISAFCALFFSPASATQDWEGPCGAVFEFEDQRELRIIPDFHVFGWQEDPIDRAALFDSRMDGIFCERSTPVPMEYDDKVVLAGYPFYIKSANEWYWPNSTQQQQPEPLLALLTLNDGKFEFRVLEGEMDTVWWEYTREQLAIFNARLKNVQQ